MNKWEKLHILGRKLNEINHKINKNNPVYRINMNGKIIRFLIRVTKQKIPQPEKCIIMIEKKLMHYI